MNFTSDNEEIRIATCMFLRKLGIVKCIKHTLSFASVYTRTNAPKYPAHWIPLARTTLSPQFLEFVPASAEGEDIGEF